MTQSILTFQERRLSLPLQVLLSGEKETIYSFSSSARSDVHTRTSLLHHFKFERDLAHWLLCNDFVQRFIESHEALSTLVRLVPSDEVGWDYRIYPMPPGDGGYSLGMLNDWHRYQDDGRPSNECLVAWDALTNATRAAIENGSGRNCRF